jgi:hypothetical protein
LWNADLAEPLDFSGKDLSFLDLSELDFKRANLAGANLLGAELTGANLAFVNLAGAKLDRTSLARANFTGADLSHVTMYDAVGSSSFEARRPNPSPAAMSAFSAAHRQVLEVFAGRYRKGSARCGDGWG